MTNSLPISSVSSVKYGKSLSSASDEDPYQQQHQNVIEERKQKRMLSNRESAKRSRMKKQQHLDDLQAQLAQLRSENSVVLNKLNIASQNYLVLEEQNKVFRALVMDLSSKLQALNSIMQQQAGTRPLISTGFSDSNPVVGNLEMEKLWLSHVRQNFKQQEIHE
ncbi:hypothetical protein SUGI_0407750 [Cryptomeria japonica]|uniref:bZIP transcription factor 11 n=1 Tax=Cryptomeria japonica TaxID=3369 RepID=UPI002408C88C|nr:bZIP transcription factor 11 [Cryptomeria japonica]GLJ21823.1 hypothetical protein SUGI_0407750 [Cryptomeria japonica]